MGGIEFVRRTERDFWLDPDGINRWVPAMNTAGKPLIEDRGGAEETCAACGTEIRWLCFVRHPSRGAQAVGRCCIRRVVRALPESEQAVYREVITDLSREMRNATRRAQGKPPIVGRKERFQAQILALEAAVRDPRVARARWVYNGNQHRLVRDALWYLNELKGGKRHSTFQTALKTALSENGHPEVFA